MSDKTKNILGWCFFIVGTLAAAIGVGLPEVYAKIVMGLGGACIAIARQLERSLPPATSSSKPASLASIWWIVLIFGYIALAPGSSGCGKWGPISSAMNASVLVTQAGNSADRIIAEHLESVDADCSKRFPAKTAGFTACVSPALKLHERWKVVRSSVSAANVVVQATLVEYYNYLKGKAGGKKIDPLRVAARSVCAIARALTELQKILPALMSARAVLASVEGIACGLSSGATYPRWRLALEAERVAHIVAGWAFAPPAREAGRCLARR